MTEEGTIEVMHEDANHTPEVKFPIKINVKRFKEGNTWIVLNEEHNLSGYGDTIEEAEELFRVAYEELNSQRLEEIRKLKPIK